MLMCVRITHSIYCWVYICMAETRFVYLFTCWKTFGLLQFCTVVDSEVKIAQSCPTLCDPMDCSLPGSSVHGISQARIMEWVAISFSRGSSQPREDSALAGRFLTTEAPGKLRIAWLKLKQIHCITLSIQSVGFSQFFNVGISWSCYTHLRLFSKRKVHMVFWVL